MELKNNDQRAKWAVGALIAFGCVMTLVMVSCLMQENMLMQWQDGVEYTEAEIAANDTRHAIIIVANVLTYIVCGIFFIMWFRRAFYNAHEVEPGIIPLGEGWAAGAWFVPFVNLVRPYHIMQEISVTTHSKANVEDSSMKGLIGTWWACWIGGNILSTIFGKVGDEATLEGLIKTSRYGAYAELIMFPALVLAIIIVRRISVVEKKLREEIHEPDIMRHLITPSEV